MLRLQIKLFKFQIHFYQSYRLSQWNSKFIDYLFKSQKVNFWESKFNRRGLLKLSKYQLCKYFNDYQLTP